MVPLTVPALRVFPCGTCHSPAQAFCWQCVQVSLRETWNGDTSHLNAHQRIQGANKWCRVLPVIGNLFHHSSLATTDTVFSIRDPVRERSTLEIPRGWASRGVWWVVLAVKVSKCSWLHEFSCRACMAGLLWDGGGREKSRMKVEATSFLYALSKHSLSKGTEHLHRQDLSLDLPPVPGQWNGVEGDCSSD